jgi:hypothetical protein
LDLVGSDLTHTLLIELGTQLIDGIADRGRHGRKHALALIAGRTRVIHGYVAAGEAELIQDMPEESKCCTGSEGFAHIDEKEGIRWVKPVQKHE